MALVMAEAVRGLKFESAEELGAWLHRAFQSASNAQVQAVVDAWSSVFSS